MNFQDPPKDIYRIIPCIELILKNEKFAECQELRTGTKNNLYTLTTKDHAGLTKNYVVKVFKDRKNFSIEAQILGYKSHSDHSPFFYVSNPNDPPFIIYKRLNKSLYDYLSDSNSAQKLSTIRMAFVELARFHAFMKDIEISNLDILQNKVKKDLKYFFKQDHEWLNLADKFSDITKDATQIIHGDSYSNNFLMDDNSTIFLIDFESVLLGHPLYDYATFLIGVNIPFSDKIDLISSMLSKDSKWNLSIKKNVEIFLICYLLRTIFVVNCFIKDADYYHQFKEKFYEYNNKMVVIKTETRECLEKLVLTNKEPYFTHIEAIQEGLENLPKFD